MQNRVMFNGCGDNVFAFYDKISYLSLFCSYIWLIAANFVTLQYPPR